ncbi:vitamin K epoxide reductase family protein [Paramicrobacterium chengjingii]|uniref:vitamin K epoxide reductase family protein n=1 Tax=Paramicrobacterium chengjingii TaxID=2769067 RepID=UPI001F1AC16C|nr:vitamin K epoxide reductase family protein [Microbacterium chengjingii]
MNESRDAALDDARPIALAIFLIIAGITGWIAAFALTLDKFTQLENPDAKLGCDFNILIGCTTNLASDQGAVFGFPNPLIGLTCWVVPIVLGVALLAGARFPRWFWLVAWAGFVFGVCLVAWFITQSIYVISSLCPWCMLTWSVMIPSFFAVTFHLLKIGAFGGGTRLRSLGATLAGWTPLITLMAYVLIAVLAQVRLDVISYIF